MKKSLNIVELKAALGDVLVADLGSEEAMAKLDELTASMMTHDQYSQVRAAAIAIAAIPWAEIKREIKRKIEQFGEQDDDWKAHNERAKP